MKRKPEKRERKGEGGISWWAADVDLAGKRRGKGEGEREWVKGRGKRTGTSVQ